MVLDSKTYLQIVYLSLEPRNPIIIGSSAQSLAKITGFTHKRVTNIYSNFFHRNFPLQAFVSLIMWDPSERVTYIACNRLGHLLIRDSNTHFIFRHLPVLILAFLFSDPTSK